MIYRFIRNRVFHTSPSRNQVLFGSWKFRDRFLYVTSFRTGSYFSESGNFGTGRILESVLIFRKPDILISVLISKFREFQNRFLEDEVRKLKTSCSVEIVKFKLKAFNLQDRLQYQSSFRFLTQNLEILIFLQNLNDIWF